MQSIDMNMIQDLLSSTQNPDMLVQQLAQNNPVMGMILKKASNSKMSMKDFAMAYAKQNNIDIQPVLDMMSKNGQ